MKKTISMILMIIMLSGMFVMPGVAAETVEVYVNGELLETDQPAIIASGRTMVPLRAVGEALGCKVTWDQKSQTAQMQNQITIVSVQINNYKLTKVNRENQNDKTTVEIDVPPILRYGRTMVPIRAIAEAFNANVEWDGINRRVNINLEYASVGSYNKYGFAKVEKNGKVGFINEKREEVIPVIYDSISTYIDDVDGYIVAKDGKKAFMDVYGKIKLNKWYEDIEDLLAYSYRGTCAVKQNGKWGLLSLDEYSLVVPCKYSDIRSAMGGAIRIWMYKDGYWGAFDCLGKLFEPFVYEKVGRHYGTSASVAGGMEYLWYCMRNGKWGQIDSIGNIKKEFIYPYQPNNGLGKETYKVSENGKYAIMHEDGRMITDFIYDEIEIASRDGFEFCIVKQNGKKGVINLVNGGVIIPIEYDDAFFDTAIIVVKNGARGAYSHTGKLLVDCIYDGGIGSGSGGVTLHKKYKESSNYALDYVDIRYKDRQYTVNEVKR